jgi:hypothetical protein
VALVINEITYLSFVSVKTNKESDGLDYCPKTEVRSRRFWIPPTHLSLAQGCLDVFRKTYRKISCF